MQQQKAAIDALQANKIFKLNWNEDARKNLTFFFYEDI